MNQPAIHAVFGEDSPRARRSDPETSHEAADAADIANSRDWVLWLLKTHGPMTDVALIGEHRQYLEDGNAPRAWSDSRIRTARNELESAGYVKKTGRKDKPEGHLNSIVWQVSA